jgi:Pyruvate/2-oxoacid:ferredoxin oxidoreductase delta subunit
LGHIDKIHESDRAENIIGGQLAHDVAEASVRQGAEVTLTSIFAVDKMQASRHEVEHAQSEGITIRGGMAPIAVLRDETGRATALRIIQCEAKIVNGRLEIKNIAGTEEDIPADLIVSAIGQAVDFTGLEEFNNGKGAINNDKNYQVQGQPGCFVGGDVIRPHLLTTAIGHGAIAADGIDRFLQNEPLEKRPKNDVHAFDLKRKMLDKGYAFTEASEPMRGTCNSTAAIHNYDDRSDRYVISHKELFLGHFPFVARNRRGMVSLTAAEALNNFQERLQPLLEAQAVAEAKRCMSCGLCFECDNCVVYCPQTAVFRVPKAKSTLGRYVDTDYNKCIGCHICADVCPTGYIQMGLGE